MADGPDGTIRPPGNQPAIPTVGGPPGRPGCTSGHGRLPIIGGWPPREGPGTLPVGVCHRPVSTHLTRAPMTRLLAPRRATASEMAERGSMPPSPRRALARPASAAPTGLAVGRAHRLGGRRLPSRPGVVAALLVVVTGAAVPGALAVRPAAADDRANLAQVQARERQVRVQLDLAVAKDTAVKAETVRLQGMVATEQALVAGDTSAAAAAATRVAVAAARVDDLNRQGEAARQALVARAVDLYEHPYRSETLLLSGVTSFDDLTTRQVLADAVQARTSDLVDAVRRQRILEEAAQRELGAAQAQAVGRQHASQGEAARLATAQAAERQADAELTKRIIDLQIETAGLAGQEASLQAKLNLVSQQYATAVAAAAADAAAHAGHTAGSGVNLGPVGSYGLQWPVHGPVTREFGYQPGGYHPGIDIAAPDFTPIAAAGDGVVIYASWESGYGNYTCIDHGRGISTCYGHQSSIGVTVGELVHRGDIIGREGSTGNSTGPHVHFEVRFNGQVTNPRLYIPGEP